MKFTNIVPLTVAVFSAFNVCAQTDKPPSITEKPNNSTKHDISRELSYLLSAAVENSSVKKEPASIIVTKQQSSGSIEQPTFGNKPAAKLVASFDGLAVGLKGLQGTAILRNR